MTHDAEHPQHVDLGERPYARWAGPEHAIVLPPRVLTWLRERLGELTPAALDTGHPEIPPSRLPDRARDRLRAIVGLSQLEESDQARLARTGGQSYTDVVRRRAQVGLRPPDAVVRPADHRQVMQVLAACDEHRVAVVPYGGGTSVVGGVDACPGPHRAVVVLDLARLDRLLDLDQDSQIATFEAGVTGPRAEQLLGEHGHTLGHFPQSFARATLGGYVATRSAGQASTGFGRIDDLVVRLRAATPVGELALGTGTPNAAGPDLRALFVGSEGTLGVLTEVSLRVRPQPTTRHYEMWAFPSLDAGLDIVRALAQSDTAPDVVRLSDETETSTGQVLAGFKGRAAAVFARMRHIRTPAFCVFGWEGEPDTVRRRRRSTLAILRDTGAISLGARAGESWRHHRFAGPLQRDALLDAGVLVETLETATTWSALPRLYDAVRSTLRDSLTQQGIEPLVLTHVSHLYPTGGSLYFTVMAGARPDPAAAIEQWQAAKSAASKVIVQYDGTITHHHAVGRTHAAYLESEIGPLGLSVLRQMKSTLDPGGILNPGVLMNSF